MTWLLGTRAQLRPVWHRYNILVKSLPETPAIIEHASLIYGIDARGRIRVGYPASPLEPNCSSTTPPSSYARSDEAPLSPSREP